MAHNLLATKLNTPLQRPNLVSRPRLMARLEEALHLRHRLTLVSAKAGSGKTTLVSEYLHQQERLTAWLSLDANDNDPHRFCSYLIAALQRLGIDMSHVGLNQVEWPQLPQADDFVTGLINDVVSASTPLILVLDDYHLIHDEWIHQAIGFLIEHQPSELYFVLITRVDPPLPLARLRGQGQITEIRDYDLQFTQQEAIHFLNDVMGLDLPVETVSDLEERTEGWVVGLQMAAISMQGRKESDKAADFIEAFGGTNRYILDYLIEEVLGQQGSAIQDFLIETSILDRMCGDLCDALRSDEKTAPDGQTVLARLERANLFIIPLDDEQRWYRYHHLFADLLKNNLRQHKSPGEIRELHRRASRWHQAEGSLEEAMIHAMAGEDFERAASMIDENIVSMFAHSEIPVLLSWIDRLPEQIVQDRPWFDVYRAYTLVLSGALEGVDSLLAKVEERIDPDMPRSTELWGHIAAIRAYAANLRGDAKRVGEMVALTSKYLPEDYLTARGMAAYAWADTCLAADDIDSAHQALLEMLRVGENIGRSLMVVTALSDLAAIEKIRGRLHQAMERYDQAYQWLAERNSLDSRVRCAYEFGLADLLREWNQLDKAHRHAMTGMEYRQRLGGYLVIGDLALMRVLQARGDTKGALDALHTAEQCMQTYHFQIAISVDFRTARVIQWLAVGDIERATHWAEALNGGTELEQIALARLRLSQGRPADTLYLLEPQQALAEAGGRTGRRIEILSLQALALDAQGRSEEAEAMLSQALVLGRPEGYKRVFLDMGEPAYDLLGRLADHSAKQDSSALEQITADYVHDLLDENGTQPNESQFGEFDQLTEREIEVLHLLVEGFTNKEMAENLVVAPSTVKQHLKNIYSKLDVHNRTQAVARGRELNLF